MVKNVHGSGDRPVVKEELTEVFMPIEHVSESDGLVAGIKKSEITKGFVGRKKVLGVYVGGVTSETAKEYNNLQSSEARASLRKKRCRIPDGHGGFKMCPESNSCSKCKRKEDPNFTTNRDLSLDQLKSTKCEDGRPFDIPDKSINVEAEALALVQIDEMIAYLNTIKDKPYLRIFDMLYHEFSVQEIADELDMPWSTTKDAINRMIALLNDMFGD